jgi:hypothetical protein
MLFVLKRGSVDQLEHLAAVMPQYGRTHSCSLLLLALVVLVLQSRSRRDERRVCALNANTVQMCLVVLLYFIPPRILILSNLTQRGAPGGLRLCLFAHVFAAANLLTFIN